MIEWFTWAQFSVAVVAGLVCIVVGLAGRRPADLTMGSALLVELLLIAQIVVAVVAPLAGNAPTGNALEFWMYLITAALIPPLAVIWGLVDRTRWSTVVLGVACLAVAVMVARMHQIWFVQVA
jgi:hypothetical protein